MTVAQDPFHYTFSIEDGLPSNEIYEIVSDSNNIVWISTDRGLCKYDGYGFETFTNEDGLGDNTNFNVFLDSKQRIWLSGFNQKLTNYSNGIFKEYEFNFELKEILLKNSGRWIEVFTEDKFGNYYIAQHEAEMPNLYRFTQNDPPQNVEIKQKDIFYKLNECNFLLKINNDFFFYHEAQKILFKTIRPSKATVTKDFIFFSGDTYIYKIDHNANLISKIDLETKIESIFFDSYDNIWVCTRNGLFLFDDGNLDEAPNHYFEGLLVSSLEQDFEENYWVGTNDNGIKFIPSFAISLIHNDENSNAKNKILSIGKLNNKLVFGTAKSKIIVCDEKNSCIDIVIDELSENAQINNFAPNKDTSALILAPGLKFDGKKVEVEFSNLPRKYKYCFRDQFKNDDYVFFYNRSLIQALSSDIKSEFTLSVKEGPVQSKLNAIIQDENENIWFGTMDGLYKVENYNYENAKLILDQNNSNLGRISDLYLDGNDNLWVSTIGNEVVFIDRNDKVIPLDKSIYLSSTMINHVLTTSDSLLWLATNNGIDVIEYKYDDTLTTNYLRTINNSDGLSSNFINDIDLWNGNIYAATNNGISMFSPNILDRKFPSVPIIITNFEVNDSTYFLSDDLRLDHTQNDILISYNGLSFQKTKDHVFYKYKLVKDVDTNSAISYTTYDRSIRFNNLDYGNYVFEVTARNKVGEWNDRPAQISFKIKPHFSETLWWNFLLFLIGCLVIYLIVRIQTRRIKLREENKRQLDHANQKMQEAELAAIRNQMNPHFVFNSLNSIQNFIFKKDVIKSNYYLSKFAELMRQSLQFSRIDFVSISKEINFLSNYLEIESLRFQNKFIYEFNVDKQVDKEQTQIPSLILQPLIENSIKHGFNNIDYQGCVKVKFYLSEGKFLMIDVSDNGLGKNTVKSTKANHTSLGINMIKNRINLLNQSKFDNMASVRFEERTNGYFVFFKIPLIIEEKVL